MSYFVSTVIRNLAVASAALAIMVLSAASIFGQQAADRKFCDDSRDSRSGREVVREARTFSLTPTGTLSVDAGKNGGISVRGEDRSDIVINACVSAWANTEEEARSAVAAVVIKTDGTVRTENTDRASVSFDIRVPRNTSLELKAYNGGIAIASVSGNVDFATVNGGVAVISASGRVKGRTTNGGVVVDMGNTQYNGSGVDVETINGGVQLRMSEDIRVNLETGTVNGPIKSNIPAVRVTTENRLPGGRIQTAINGGGAPVRVITLNGGVVISTAK